MNCIANIGELNIKFWILPRGSEEFLLTTAELLDGMKKMWLDRRR